VKQVKTRLCRHLSGLPVYTDNGFGSRRCNDPRSPMSESSLAIELGMTFVFAWRENKRGACYRLASSSSIPKLAGVTGCTCMSERFSFARSIRACLAAY
jgi:hypothetical protein